VKIKELTEYSVIWQDWNFVSEAPTCAYTVAYVAMRLIESMVEV